MFACVEGAACVGIDKIWMTILYSNLYLTGFLVLLLMFIYWKTPAFEFLGALMSGKSIVYITNRSQQGKFFTAKPNAEGMFGISGVGPILISENSHTIERVSGRPLYVAFGEFASTLPIWWVAAINKIRKKFSKEDKPIYDISGLGKYTGRKFDEKDGAWKITEPEGDNEEITIQPWITIKLHDLANMFPYNITPALIESKTTHAIARKQRMWNSMNPQIWITAVIVLAFIVVIGYIAFKFFGGGAPQVDIIVDQTGRIIGQNKTVFSG